jgi:hypothetical protein
MPAGYTRSLQIRKQTMPLTRGSDAEGAYYRWGPAGNGGAKYHYAAGNKASRERAKAKAIEVSKHSGGAAKRKHSGGAAKRKPAAKKPAAKRKPAAAPPAEKVGGKTPRKPRKKTVSSTARAKQKVADKSRVTETAAYRRAAKRK